MIIDPEQQAALCAELKNRIDALFAERRDGPARAWYETEGGRRHVYVVIANGAVKPEGHEAPFVGFEAKALEATVAEVAKQFPHHAHQRVVWRQPPSYTTSSSTARFNDDTFEQEDEFPEHDRFVLRVRLTSEDVYEVEIPQEEPALPLRQVASA